MKRFIQFFSKKLPSPSDAEIEIYNKLRANVQDLKKIINSFNKIEDGRIAINKAELIEKLDKIIVSIQNLDEVLARENVYLPGDLDHLHFTTSDFCQSLSEIIKAYPNSSRLMRGLLNLHVTNNEESVILGVYKPIPHQQPLPDEDFGTVAKSTTITDSSPLIEVSKDYLALEPNEFDSNLNVVEKLQDELVVTPTGSSRAYFK